MKLARIVAIWAAVVAACVVPAIVAAMSPLHEWRSPVYIVAGFSGVIGLSLMFLQPILAAGLLPGVSSLNERRIHRFIGIALASCVVVHIIGLWITSPPDVVDALLFVSATPFSIWGVIAMWSIAITVFLVFFRRRLKLRVRRWRLSHRCLAAVTVLCTVLHAIRIEGTMGMVSKAALCVLIVLATGFVLIKRQ